MTDIRTYINLIESIQVDESFRVAKQKFETEADTNVVDDYIKTFRELTSKNIVTGSNKDIGQWIRSGWENFKNFVDSNKNTITKSKQRTQQKKDSIIAYEDEDKTILIPLSKDAAILYGKNTKWCTSAIEDNAFRMYFYNSNGYPTTLFYILMKDGSKFAAMKEGDSYEFYNSADTIISQNFFEYETRVTTDALDEMYNEHKTRIEHIRTPDMSKLSNEELIEYISVSPYSIKKIENPSEDIQLAAVKSEIGVYTQIKNPALKATLYVLKKDGSFLVYIKDPTDEMILAALDGFPAAIKLVAEPSVNIQMHVIKDNPHNIKYLKRLDMSVLKAALEIDERIIKYFKDPSENLQRLAITNGGSALKNIKNPTEDMIVLHNELWSSK